MYKFFLYRPIICTKTGLPDFEKVSTHASYAALLKAHEKQRAANPKIFKVVLPVSLKLGDTLYRETGETFGEIVEEMESFWFIQRPKKTEIPPIRLIKHVQNKKKTEVIEEFVERVFVSAAEKQRHLDSMNQPVCFMKANINSRFVDGYSGRKAGFIIPLEKLGVVLNGKKAPV